MLVKDTFIPRRLGAVIQKAVSEFSIDIMVDRINGYLLQFVD